MNIEVVVTFGLGVVHEKPVVGTLRFGVRRFGIRRSCRPFGTLILFRGIFHSGKVTS